MARLLQVDEKEFIVFIMSSIWKIQWLMILGLEGFFWEKGSSGDYFFLIFSALKFKFIR